MRCDLVRETPIGSAQVNGNVNVVKSASRIRATNTSHHDEVSPKKEKTSSTHVQRIYLPIGIDPVTKSESILGPPLRNYLSARKLKPDHAKIAVFERVQVLE